MKLVSKGIPNKIKEETYYKCTHCEDEIFWNTHKKFTYCKCKKIWVDGCEDYVRVGGNEGDYKASKKSYYMLTPNQQMNETMKLSSSAQKSNKVVKK